MTEKSVRLETITYQYNGVGLVSDMAVSGESSFTYSYNARNQLSSVTNPNSVQVSFTFDNGGRRARITDPGSYVEYVYNARNWLTDVRNRTTGGTTRYDATYYYQDGNLWDHTGNPVKRTENLAGSTYTTTLRYDAVYRQTEETKRDSGNNVVYSLTYGYDAVGNRTSRTLGGTTITYTYDDNNKLTSANDGSSFGYDSNGNMTSVSGPLGSKTMVYNDDDRLTSITYGTTTDLYYYTYTGQRYRAALGGTTYRYLYNGERVLEELNDSGTMQARYTTEDGGYGGTWLHLYRPSGTLSRFPMYDDIGSVRGLVDASGTVTDTYELDTFGRSVSSTGTTPNPYRYGGAWGYITDPSAMLQLGHRFYWPEVGRFVSQDPIRTTTAQYTYADNEPVIGFDPDGLKVTYCGPDKNPTHLHRFLCTDDGGGCTIDGVKSTCWGFGNWHNGGEVRDENKAPGQNPKKFDCNEDDQTKCADPKKLCDEIGKSKKNPPKYNFWKHNCRHWADDMLKKAKKPGCGKCPGK